MALVPHGNQAAPGGGGGAAPFVVQVVQQLPGGRQQLRLPTGTAAMRAFMLGLAVDVRYIPWQLFLSIVRC